MEEKGSESDRLQWFGASRTFSQKYLHIQIFCDFINFWLNFTELLSVAARAQVEIHWVFHCSKCLVRATIKFHILFEIHSCSCPDIEQCRQAHPACRNGSFYCCKTHKKMPRSECSFSRIIGRHLNFAVFSTQRARMQLGNVWFLYIGRDEWRVSTSATVFMDSNHVGCCRPRRFRMTWM